jgi:hypothetical protein
VALQNLGGGIYTAVVNLRAERFDNVSTGHVYTIIMLAVDPTGNVGRASTIVAVPTASGIRLIAYLVRRNQSRVVNCPGWGFEKNAERIILAPPPSILRGQFRYRLDLVQSAAELP